ncbi:hypothetical protein GE061_004551 [Apolygus lucorum]|uniref:Calcineurin-like phosphoesterase domain-containing protein n=1 Tax=Apolygus lucorum TaxID=248454 RepID=A0A6A4IQF6_APOLU|nr:hypothetical protein GE061_004551 [Apolygus lucorum]
MSIDVHPLSSNPTGAWKELSLAQKVIKINVSPVTHSPSPNKARIVCMSDTHSLTPHIRFKVPDGDIFIHAGDFTRCGLEDEVVEFNNWIGKLPHKHKIVIAGNHELSFDRSFTHPLSPNFVKNIPTLGNPQSDLVDAVSKVNIRDRLTNCIYLQDEMAEPYGLRIYGTPWQPEFQGWAFNVRRGADCLRKWDKIPDNVDILISHTPPVGHGDLCCSGVRAGCVELLSVVQKRIKPKYHVFGHIHEGYGITTDGSIIYINASTCNINYKPVNPPIVFDVTLPEGRTVDR